MTSRPARNAKRYRRILTLVGALIFCSLAQPTLAQGPIRVETNQVLVPVIVVDGERLHRVWRIAHDGALAGDLSPIGMDFTVDDLVSADFQLLDDGKEQPILSVTKAPSLSWAVLDNEGTHTEYIGPGGGKWSAKWLPGHTLDIEFPEYYVVAYTLPKSPGEGTHLLTAYRNIYERAIQSREDKTSLYIPVCA